MARTLELAWCRQACLRNVYILKSLGALIQSRFQIDPIDISLSSHSFSHSLQSCYLIMSTQLLPSLSDMLGGAWARSSRFHPSPSSSLSPIPITASFTTPSSTPSSLSSSFLDSQTCVKTRPTYSAANVNYIKSEAASETHKTRCHPLTQSIPPLPIKADAALKLPTRCPTTHARSGRVIKHSRPVTNHHHQLHHHHYPSSQSYNSIYQTPRTHRTGSTTPDYRHAPISIFVDRQEKRRKNHLNSEKKRRENIKCGMDALFDLVPACRDKGESKAQVLSKTKEYINQLKQEIDCLREENQFLRAQQRIVVQAGA
ncbi:hypothetical protein EX30DRAFT_364590 [Ascodesmis nigricans]|uniref:BHLH domain-containing protein n=1 Tax=Ascodesmis nigricans TaxID=341454 RepID=A0A4S2MV28_9PEZI|nr:hypothetical protein EX30DRAFT_364590 [Ascodesmis nigricans]